jgi:hypothetical protein
LGAERATVPRIVLPVTGRGVELTDRVCWTILGVAMLAAAALILYLNRGTVFFVDELTWLYATPALGVADVLDPDNGHLVATTRIVYKAILETVGADYLAFRLLGVSSVLLCTGLFYALVRRRIGALPALAPALVLLFLGSAAGHFVIPVGFTPLCAIAAGLAALLALERDDSRGDAAACALLVLSVATFTTGLAFVAGLAVSVLLRADRRRRAWIFLVPLALYGAWWLGTSPEAGASGGAVRLANALLIPSYAAESLAAVSAAVSGLGYDFSDPLGKLELGWGRVLAAFAVVALAVRIRHGNVPASLWASLAIVLVFWTLGALVSDPLVRLPGIGRYIDMGTVGVLLVATDAARGLRFSRLGLSILFTACAVSMATNIALLRERGADFRDQYSAPVRARLSMVELARARVRPDFAPLAGVPALSFTASPASAYVAIVDRYGSPAYSLAELESRPEGDRRMADRALARALRLHLERAPSGTVSHRCVRARAQPTEPIGFELPQGGATLRAEGAGAAELALGRFGDVPAAELGALAPGRAMKLALPPDASPRPWTAAVTGASSVEVCELG